MAAGLAMAPDRGTCPAVDQYARESCTKVMLDRKAQLSYRTVGERGRNLSGAPRDHRRARVPFATTVVWS